MNIGGLPETLLDQAVDVRAETRRGTPSVDYGLGRCCDYCAGPVNRWAAPHRAGVLLCSLCLDRRLLPDDSLPVAGSRGRHRHDRCGEALERASLALEWLRAGVDASDALDEAWDAIEAAMEAGGTPISAAHAYLAALHLLEALADPVAAELEAA